MKKNNSLLAGDLLAACLTWEQWKIPITAHYRLSIKAQRNTPKVPSPENHSKVFQPIRGQDWVCAPVPFHCKTLNNYWITSLVKSVGSAKWMGQFEGNCQGSGVWKILLRFMVLLLFTFACLIIAILTCLSVQISSSLYWYIFPFFLLHSLSILLTSPSS